MLYPNDVRIYIASPQIQAILALQKKNKGHLGSRYVHYIPRAPRGPLFFEGQNSPKRRPKFLSKQGAPIGF